MVIAFQFSIEDTSRKARGNRAALELNAIRKLLVYAGDNNLLNRNISTTEQK
jgi:hypothetical protein